MALCAAARIGCRLRVEPDRDTITLRLFRLKEDHHTQHAVAGHGERLVAAEPFPFALDAAALVRRR
ncbi:hypothetical protein [Actinoplanes teichomyceticus]|uniref:Uncharacterized protein n=1 Tax=Actinoplanes teichomyceticus TaxID=1867 RepID=A0A561WLD9_ACTTI|nr:hypothetical protein [Actinoplanes teichomyceticus]TWG24688.1 hypothetical protein FHX34_1021248 [Actinoplanes teichomyceticus]GIF14649.1 hypothetical protein Ate01nite_46810 [Actinoplanes teichomyceticus]